MQSPPQSLCQADYGRGRLDDERSICRDCFAWLAMTGPGLYDHNENRDLGQVAVL